jgi:methylphosphotriester-DNA--protein-cysteine methyltransferase
MAVAVASVKPIQSASQTPPSANGQASYVASKNSDVFHRADCKSAAKIAARNVIRYNTRDEAVSAGKRPCAECRP